MALKMVKNWISHRLFSIFGFTYFTYFTEIGEYNYCLPINLLFNKEIENFEALMLNV